MQHSGPVFFAKRVLHGLRYRIIGENHVSAFLWLKQKLGSGETILFLPVGPPTHPGYVAGKVCAYIGLQPISSGHPSTGIAMFWQDVTHTDQPPVTPYRLINARCTDISKRKIEKTMEEVLGYSLAIDPLTYVGKAVCKSDTNSLHDGMVIDCPIAARDTSKVYEVLIDNSISEKAVEDIRVVIVGSRLVIVYLKRRWKHQRFLNTNFEVVAVEPSSVLSESEIQTVLKFAKAIGLDFGEMDVLRDRPTGKLYIVDASKNAFGPPARLAFAPKIRAVRTISEAFQLEFLAKKS